MRYRPKTEGIKELKDFLRQLKKQYPCGVGWDAYDDAYVGIDYDRMVTLIILITLITHG